MLPFTPDAFVAGATGMHGVIGVWGSTVGRRPVGAVGHAAVGHALRAAARAVGEWGGGLRVLPTVEAAASQLGERRNGGVRLRIRCKVLN